MSVILLRFMLRLSCVARSRAVCSRETQGTLQSEICLKSVFYVIYVTLIMHDDSASADDILRVNLRFGT